MSTKWVTCQTGLQGGWPRQDCGCIVGPLLNYITTLSDTRTATIQITMEHKVLETISGWGKCKFPRFIISPEHKSSMGTDDLVELKLARYEPMAKLMIMAPILSSALSQRLSSIPNQGSQSSNSKLPLTSRDGKNRWQFLGALTSENCWCRCTNCGQLAFSVEVYSRYSFNSL